MNSRKYLISVGLAMGAALGAAGIAAASSNTSNAPAPVVQTQTSAVEPQIEGDAAVEVNGVDCENGIVVATGAECDGGPSANSTDDKNEANDNEADNDVETNDDGADQSGTNNG